MTPMLPLVLATNGTLPRFLYRPENRGGEAQVLADPVSQGYTLSPSPGTTRDFPSLATLRPIADRYRAQLAGNEWNIYTRDAIGRTLNNVGAHQILNHQPADAFNALLDAEEQFIEMYKMHPQAPRSLIGLASVRYNVALNDHLHGSRQQAAETFASARQTIEQIPAPDRDAGYNLVDRALTEAQAQL